MTGPVPGNASGRIGSRWMARSEPRRRARRDGTTLYIDAVATALLVDDQQPAWRHPRHLADEDVLHVLFHRGIVVHVVDFERPQLPAARRIDGGDIAAVLIEPARAAPMHRLDAHLAQLDRGNVGRRDPLGGWLRLRLAGGE